MSHLPSPEEKSGAVRSMFDRIAPRYDVLNRVMSLGQDMRWRRHAVERLHLPIGSVVLDVACGTGDLCRTIEEAGMQPIGLDFSFGMLSSAKTAAPLVQGDALKL